MRCMFVCMMYVCVCVCVRVCVCVLQEFYRSIWPGHNRDNLLRQLHRTFWSCACPSVLLSSCPPVCPPPRGRGILVCVLPSVWNLRAFSLIPLFYGPILFFCLVLLLFLSSFFCYWPIHPLGLVLFKIKTLPAVTLQNLWRLLQAVSRQTYQPIYCQCGRKSVSFVQATHSLSRLSPDALTSQIDR